MLLFLDFHHYWKKKVNKILLLLALFYLQLIIEACLTDMVGQVKKKSPHYHHIYAFMYFPLPVFWIILGQFDCI
jgi:hypothetical protein